MPLNQYGQTQIDPRAQLLLGRALRPEPIDTGMSLIGRLAALGVGQQQQRTFEQGIAEARLGYANALQQAGADPAARLAVLSQGAASMDPGVRADALSQIAALSKRESKLITTPGGGTSAVQMQGGEVAGVQPIVQGRAAAPQMFTFKDGETERTLMFDPESGGMIDIATAPREALQRILPPDVLEQQLKLRTAAGRAQGEATGAALAGITAESAARAQGAADVKRAEALGAKARYQEQARTTLAQIEAAIAAAGAGGALSPSQADKLEGLRTAAAIAMARAQSENPEQEPNSDIVQGLKVMLPGSVKGAAGITGGLDAAYALVGGRPQGAAAPAAKAPQEMTDEELRAEIARLRGGK
jgi:hypothetical protein